MTKNPEDQEQPESFNDGLYRLIRLAHDLERSESSPGEAERPPDEVIVAYLSGSATDQQEAQILDACEQSPSFASELARIVEDYETFTSEETTRKMADTPVSVPPDLARQTGIQTGSGHIWRIIIPSVAAVLIMALLLIPPMLDRQDTRQARWTAMSDAEIAHLSKLGPRGATEDDLVLFPSPREAALAEFRERLQVNWDTETLEIDSRYQSLPVSGLSDTLNLSIRGFGGDALQEAVFEVPSGTSSGAEVWLIDPSTLRLWSQPVPVDPSITIPEGLSDWVLMTVVYPVGAGYRASAAEIIKQQ